MASDLREVTLDDACAELGDEMLQRVSNPGDLTDLARFTAWVNAGKPEDEFEHRFTAEGAERTCYPLERTTRVYRGEDARHNGYIFWCLIADPAQGDDGHTLMFWTRQPKSEALADVTIWRKVADPQPFWIAAN